MGNIYSMLFIAFAIVMWTLIRKSMAAKISEQSNDESRHFGENFPFPIGTGALNSSDVDGEADNSRTSYVDSVPSFDSDEQAYDWGDATAVTSPINDQKGSLAVAKTLGGSRQSALAMQLSSDSSFSEGRISSDDPIIEEQTTSNGQFHIDLRQAIIYNEILRPKHETI